MVIYNSHFDHMGESARENSAQLILNHIIENGYSKNAVVVMGDFNAEPDDAPILLLSKNLDDTFSSTFSNNPTGTFNGFQLDSNLAKRIDYIFTKNIEVVQFKHIHKKLPNGLWPSDHFPVFVTIKEFQY